MSNTTISVSDDVKKKLYLEKVRGNFKKWDYFLLDILKKSKEKCV